MRCMKEWVLTPGSDGHVNSRSALTVGILGKNIQRVVIVWNEFGYCDDHHLSTALGTGLSHAGVHGVVTL